jgi:hypothetical protein
MTGGSSSRRFSASYLRGDAVHAYCPRPLVSAHPAGNGINEGFGRPAVLKQLGKRIQVDHGSLLRPKSFGCCPVRPVQGGKTRNLEPVAQISPEDVWISAMSVPDVEVKHLLLDSVTHPSAGAEMRVAFPCLAAPDSTAKPCSPMSPECSTQSSIAHGEGRRL